MKLKEYIRKNNRPLGQVETLFLVIAGVSGGSFILSFLDAFMRGARWPACFILFLACMLYYALFLYARLRPGLGHSHGATTPMQQLAETILHMAVRSGVDKIVFGEPPHPFEVEPPPPERSLHDLIASGVLTEAEKQEIEHLLQNEDKSSGAMAELIEATDPFRASPVKEVPIWHRFNGKWQQGAPISLRILNALVDEFASRSTTDVCVKMGDLVTHRVRYSVAMETNFCYSITIEDVQVVGLGSACDVTTRAAGK